MAVAPAQFLGECVQDTKRICPADLCHNLGGELLAFDARHREELPQRRIEPVDPLLDRGLSSRR